LDAVLTDAGRERLARGDGSFKIVKFALGDDEIDYENYNGTDPRGSAFYDIEILQTPVLEAFTNNTSSMKSKLITITRTNLLYLPVILFNGDSSKAGGTPFSKLAGLGENIILAGVDDSTITELSAADTGTYDASTSTSAPVVLDQGLNTTAISATTNIPEDLYESQYQIQMDNRLISLTTPDTASPSVATASFVDDDSIASYSVSSTDYVNAISTTTTGTSVIAGPRGSRLQLGLRSSLDLQSSTYLFTTLGSEVQASIDGTLKTFYYIDTTVRITGLTTGNSIDLPVRLLKYKSTP
jgi:hypothetical protein